MISNNSKRIVEQTNCPVCPSSDAFTVYEEAGKQNGYCFSCNHYTDKPYEDLEGLTNESIHEDSTSNSDLSTNVVTAIPVSQSYKKSRSSHNSSQLKIDLDEGMKFPIPLGGIPSRKLSYKTCEHFGVRVGVSPLDGVTPLFSLFPRYRNNQIVGWKTIDKDKNIVSTGGANVDPFGLHLIKSKGKKLWITEGEYDAMALYQSLRETSGLDNWEPDVISIPNGAVSAATSLSRHYDKLIAFDEIIIVFDSDEVGRAARDEVLKLFSGKACYVDIPSPYKDANDMVMAGKSADLKWLCLTNYQKYQPDGIVNAKDLKEEYFDNTEQVYYPFPPTMPVLNEKLYGAFPGSIVTITSGSGCGKTQTMRELMYHYEETTDEKIAGIFLEEGKVETLKGLVSLDVNKRLGLPDVEIPREVEEASYDRLFNSGRISLYDYFGGMDDNNLLSKLRYFAITGHRFIFLDHLSIVVSEYAAEGGERERIDTLMTKLAKFVKEFNIVLFLVVHLRKPVGSDHSFEEGARPSLDDLRGSGSLKQLSWVVLGITRNQQHYDNYCKNVIELCVLKSRKTGRTGIADYLHFDDNTGRLYKINKPENLFPTKKQLKELHDND